MFAFLRKIFARKGKSISLGDVMPRRIAGKYDAAQTTPDNSQHWGQADSLSADASASKSVRKTLRDRSRYEIANNSYARGMVTSIADICIGTGPKLQLRTGRKTTNQKIEDAWSAWSKEIGLAEILRTLRMTWIDDGEGFLYPIDNPELAGPVKMDLRLVEADQVTDPSFNYVTVGDVDGIHFDAAGNPEFYTVLREHPGSNDFNGVDAFDTIPASLMMHTFRHDRPGQHRGIPEITPALPLFAMLRRYTLAVLSAAETAADMALVLQTDADAYDESESPEPLDEIDLTRNMLTTMPKGWKLGQVKPEQPITGYSEFKTEILGEVARCLQIPKSIALGTSEGMNYASGRLDHQSFFRTIDVDRAKIERDVLDRVFSMWLRQFQLGRQAFRDINGMPNHEWFWDGLLHVDPKKEADAEAVRIANHTTTYASAYAKQGKDWREQFAQVALEKELMEELNILPADLVPVVEEEQPEETEEGDEIEEAA